ncbi:MAG: alanyl-tRNA synthetase [Patescibacteria group bacterium]|nr:alanyl-tRNA synthetase [Patescibacteria group bacterium]
MNTQQIRKAYLDFAKQNGHAIIPRVNLVPKDDPTILFTGFGMQPLLPYLLGEPHPLGKRVADSQPCIRAQDIEDVGDNRHTTFFEMLGNWSFGDYFKQEQITWMFNFLVEIVGLDPNRLYVSCFIGSKEQGVPKDLESAHIWQKLFLDRGIKADIADIGSQKDGDKRGIKPNERIFFYDDGENWWSRGGGIADTPIGDPCGPDSEMFYDFGPEHHDASFGKAHPASDSGRFIEIGNQVFMQYKRTEDGFVQLDKPNVDFGGGLERIAAAAIDSPDVFKISVLWPIVEKLQKLSGKSYNDHTQSMRVIADHLRGATFMAVDGVTPSNKTQGYVMRRIIRRAIRFALELGIENDVCDSVVPVIADLYHNDYPEVKENRDNVITILKREEKIFRQTLRSGVKEFDNLTSNGTLNGKDVFRLYDTFGFPLELSIEEANNKNIKISKNWRKEFDDQMAEQRARSQTAAKGKFKGGLADHSEISTKYHTATHLMYKALRMVLGDHVIQRGSNITEERLRFDFSQPEKVSKEQLKQVEDIVNQQIKKDWPMTYREENTQKALASGVMGAFGDKYGDTVKVYTVGDPDGVNYSREICGGPHVEHTGQLSEGGKAFVITKEQASSSGVRRIKAVLK